MQADALRPGDPKRLGSYELLGRLGDGGQGVVFLGRAEDGTHVAIKLLHRELIDDDTARVRFLREIEFAKQVASFCTAQIIDADIEGERPYLVSEYVPGPSVLQLVHRDGPISGGALDRLAIGTATALVAIHQAGVIHRDFKPANVLIGPGGPRVIDFGIARVFDSANTMTSRVIGTPAFMSPEQMRGREFGKEADIFCWAATMAYAASGRPPFGNDSIPAVIQRALNEAPDLGDIAEPLRGLLTDCLAKHPADRPDARELLMRLLGQEDAPRSEFAAATPAADDPAAILVKIAEATARTDRTDRTDRGDESAITQSLGRPHSGLPEATSPRLPARYAEHAEYSDYAEQPAERRGRSRAAVLTVAIVAAIAGTAGGAAYVLAQSPSGVRNVNNPTTEPIVSDTPTEEPTSKKPKKPAPIVRTTLRPSPTRTTSPKPSPTRTTQRPTPTPTKTQTATPTPTRSTPEPSETPPEPTGS